MHPYEGVWGALLDDVLCGRPAGHNGRCRSVQALARARASDRARWPVARVQRQARREFARLSLTEQARERAIGR